MGVLWDRSEGKEIQGRGLVIYDVQELFKG